MRVSVCVMYDAIYYGVSVRVVCVATDNYDYLFTNKLPLHQHYSPFTTAGVLVFWT